MRKILVLAAAAALATVAGAASAETVAATASAPVAAIKAGRIVVSSDGRSIGRVDRVEADRIGVIADGRYLYLPTSTLSVGEKNRVVTSMTTKQVFAGR